MVDPNLWGVGPPNQVFEEASRSRAACFTALAILKISGALTEPKGQAASCHTNLGPETHLWLGTVGRLIAPFCATNYALAMRIVFQIWPRPKPHSGDILKKVIHGIKSHRQKLQIGL